MVNEIKCTRTFVKAQSVEYDSNIMKGFILIDKPEGITSFDVVARLRRLTGEKRIGHAGTLDPFATGLLLIAVSREATRELQKFVGLDKRYEATFILGATSTTDDIKGEITLTPNPSPLTPSVIEEALKTVTGTIDQVPPTYAAIKVQGKKLYELARAGTPTLVEPRKVKIYSIECLSNLSDLSDFSNISLRIHCSSGTYIRSIARDLGAKLSVGGYVSELRRTSIGLFVIADAMTFDQLDSANIESHLIKIESFLSRLT
ncbi:tRNA pseudouridine(55) synthase TruB [Candidatus Uhrbacteria bacterium RIFCSPHIGHO2_02_FULL_47_44]|uniref:tRNA pseudouridine synthase B n=1 Tax=Candidatus Uhrbacteria bacterium RIFCSPLOWO2_02_FULL_48_18 TaxID=1802408 RepID=A0A1F7VDD4_9BACT|nr:MAG: tRNA pseudouridine(55) synthase TruB [Candidatus Uhrbacteria bacterium RIFCSPHIGHO2_01_FULL_47_10]OGL70026.1 MAG: tRNA pseudouridine(55) synthase TruB [Candidatus Uhrbacteria bacterium RIFCSPHIGHO2_02_FULL_47_44]OGL77318.1 MAG: tRNA pseudouridine(55) synthase TruB [Candidatus Uhrbacteria bacterium RIFCSPHIGHO2_12_FULL_47_12]OGL80679.1 MAG: tRNA pseudouridine(55) synthase TruB [Candidatus Uhrbacteria bacterium RIFCSPLOWO2_01_FULL_47_17]OGL88138.1 MAG: tRNA pseudouridine(55) synthase TruB